MASLTLENGLYIKDFMEYLYPIEAGGIILPQAFNSSEELNEDLVLSRTYSGYNRIKSNYPNLGINKSFNKIFNINHEVLNTDQKDWILQFYKVNRLNPFKFTWMGDNKQYYVLFLRPPKITMHGGQWWKVELNLIQVNPVLPVFYGWWQTVVVFAEIFYYEFYWEPTQISSIWEGWSSAVAIDELSGLSNDTGHIFTQFWPEVNMHGNRLIIECTPVDSDYGINSFDIKKFTSYSHTTPHIGDQMVKIKGNSGQIKLSLRSVGGVFGAEPEFYVT